MGTTILLIVLLLAAFGCGIAALVVRRPDDGYSDVNPKAVLGMVAGGLFVVFVIFLAFSTLVIVPTREVGIELTFAKPTGTVGNGLHVKAPWQDIETMDAAIQTDSYTQAPGNGDCITTRIAHQAVACVDVSIRWRIVEGAAGNLYQNYRSFDNVRDSLVTRDLKSAVNQVMETYDVLAVNDQGLSTAPQLSDVGSQVTGILRGLVGNQIDVLSVIIPVMHFDESTQGRINALQAQIAQTRIAEQAENTAKAQAAANSALAATVSKDPNVLVSKCLDLINEAITKSYALPAGFSCWQGGSSAVVVPSGGKP